MFWTLSSGGGWGGGESGGVTTKAPEAWEAFNPPPKNWSLGTGGIKKGPEGVNKII